MQSLGSALSFITEDAVNKINILLEFLKGENKANYLTVQSMVAYEINYGLVDFDTRDKHPDSGCRSLLMLHRSLCWLHLFLVTLIDVGDSQPSDISSMAYRELLARYHDHGQQEAAEMAFGLLPKRTKVFEALNTGSEEQVVVSMLRETLGLMNGVCEITGTEYYKYEMLDLP